MLILSLLVVSVSVAYRSLNYANVCIEVETEEQVENCLKILPRLKIDLERIYRIVRVPAVGEVLAVMNEIEPLLPYRDYLLGVGKPTKYIFLQLNDQELRTNGGFMGSYAIVNMIDRVAEVKFQDIYVPDGHLPGYVEPPAPLQEAFKTGSHRLPNADWSPDFPRSADAIRWFFDKGGESEPDVLVTVTLSTVKEIMKVIGPVKVPEYDITATDENITQWLQDNAEVDFFPGSTQKKDAISAVGNAIVAQSKEIGWRQQVRIARILLDDLNKQNILVNSLNDELEEVLIKKNWAGVYAPLPCPTEDCQIINTGVIEMNLGANKANCCVSRSTFQKVSESPDGFIHLIEVKLKNFSTSEQPNKPFFYGGNYLSYLRFYIPIEATNITVVSEPSILSDYGTWPLPYDGERGSLLIQDVYGFKEVGFFHLTRAGEETLMAVSYVLPDQGKRELWLNVMKQHGLRESFQEIEILGKKVETDLETDYLVQVDR